MWSDQFSVADKIVLLTGAAGGIGMALLQGFLEVGAHVYAVTRRDDTDWQGLDARFCSHFHPLCCDLSKTEDIKRLITDTELKEDTPDILINNASDCPHLTDDIYNIETLRLTMRVTLEAAYVLCGTLAPRMAERGKGSIINVTTMNAEQAWPGNPPYIAAKSALRMLTKAVARDFGEKGVRANNLCPGYVRTRLTEQSFSNSISYEERRSHTMLGRWGTPEDMVGPCLFLASDASAYITGSDLHVEGGWLTKGM